MKEFKLTAMELQELYAAHKAARCVCARDAYKINAIILLGSGWEIDEVATALLLDDETLRSYIKKYKAYGIEGILKTNYRGSECQLNEEQLCKLRKELDTNIHTVTDSIIDFIKREFSIEYSKSGITDFLHRLGYVYKKPKLVPGKMDTQAQEEFIDYYEDFMLNKSPDTEVFFADGVHPEHNTTAAYGWIKKGEERPLKTNSGRQRINIHGALNIETLETVIVENEKVNSESTIELLEKIEEACPASPKIYVILDNARYHYSALVKEYLTTSRIELIFLPTYSPNLNLIERLWRFFKKKVLHNTYYETFKEFKASCMNFFEGIDAYKNELKALLSEDFHIIEANNTS